ncbi:probable G-protein coupled receptor 139 [Scyliorhinus torazame]|uniref:probable G-protein coupled receptor 139 n=1 Tax=Scyliorhinus torazame TaxID=75743 RepID=UPI003B5AF839
MWDRRVNLVAIVILSREKCGLSTCTVRYLVAMATADLLVIINEVILRQINQYYFPALFLNISPACSVPIVLICAATDCSVWFTVSFAFDRFVAICCLTLKIKYCTEKTAVTVLSTAGILLCLKNIPYYFTFKPYDTADDVPFICYTKPSFYSEPGWVAFDLFDKIQNPFSPFVLIMLFNALTVRHVLMVSRFRKRLRAVGNSENRSDPEIKSRKKSMILLFTISGSFLLLWSTYFAEFLYYSFSGFDPNNYSDSLHILQQVGIMLINVSCCTNTFIYVASQSKFREHFKRAVKYPATSIIKLIT